MQFFIAIIAYYLTACASPLAGKKVTFDREVTITKAGKSPQKLGAEETITLEESPVYIEAEGHVGVLLVPHNSKGPVAVNLRPLESWGGPIFTKANKKTTGRLIGSIIEVQKSLSTPDAPLALQQVKDLRSRHPQLTWLAFLEATAHYILNQKPQAISSLESALRDFPENQDGKNLYFLLTGKNWEVNPT